MDNTGDGRGALTAAGVSCGSCGTELPPNSKFCNECGAPLTHASRSAEYKQVTVLFADVVHSMDIAAAVGAERLREIMADLVNRAAVVVQRYGGTVGSFTGDGVMAVFGAPLALEDHAVRACLAALEIQGEITRLAAEVGDRDGVELSLRIGLNSGQVIAGEVGSASLGYTAIGEQVGMAQRMESVASPGGVMLSASTARLVEGTAVLGEPESVRIKGAEEPVAARRLLGMGDQHHAVSRAESNLVGRRWEMSAVEALLERAVAGQGAVVGVIGSPGIGKSRLVREVSAMAGAGHVDVFTAFCESHTSQVPFHAVARLLRAATGVEGLDEQTARDRVRDGIPEADPEDVLLFDDMLGIADPTAPLPAIDPDARRRRLTALVNAASLAREAPAVYVVEDAHWIDAVSESMLADFFTVIPQTPSLVLVTYRPDYEGALSRIHGTQTIALAPLNDPETAALVSELLGADPSVGALGQTIADRAAGNPFFAEEIVRELAERGVLRGESGAYISTAEVSEVSAPATLQATIAARIDRLPTEAKRTLSAAAVIGSRFGLDLLTQLGVEPAVTDLVAAQFIDQVKFTRQPEYVFHHPLIRAVAYEAQLKSDRAEMHRRLAAAIEQRDHESVGESAALIAEHLEAAGDLRSAYAWHMRAGAWSGSRDIRAARISWERARRVADALPANDPERTAMRIRPRTALCTSTWRVGLGVADTGFDELRGLCASAGDDLSLAIGMYGQVVGLSLEHRHREASALASEQVRLLEARPDALRAVGVMHGAARAKLHAGEAVEAYRLAQWSIDLVGDDPVKGRSAVIGSPLAVALFWRGLAGCSLGRHNWRDDMRTGIAMQRSVDAHGGMLPVLITVAYARGILTGALLADDDAVRETAEAVRLAEECGDDVALELAHLAHGLVLSRRATAADRVVALEVLRRARDAQVRQRNLVYATMADIRIAELIAEAGEVQGAIESARSIVDRLFENGEMFLRGAATAALVESLLRRWIGHRLTGSGGCNRTVGRRANRPRIRPERNPAAAAPRTAGQGARRRDRVSRLSGSLPRARNIVGFRGASGVGRGDAMTAAAPSGVVTFLFTDVEGSTRRWETDADQMRVALAAHDEVLRAAIEVHGGFMFKHTGDGVCAAFASPRSAVEAAVAAQRALELPVRMGLATGEAELREADYFGAVLNRAARVMAAGHGGQVLLDGTTAGLCSSIDLMALGPRRLRDIATPVEMFQVLAVGLRSEFPPLTTLDATPGNLRPQTTSFIGRETELAEVEEALKAHRLVTLTGVGGVGKTRLATEVATRLADEFPDGVWLFELAAVTDPAAVPDAVSAVLGITQQPAKTVSESVAAALEGRVRLLVFDNCEHVLDAVADLVDAILAQSETVRIVATSREGLGVADEQVWPVSSLDVVAGTGSPAVELFVERSRAIAPRFSMTDEADAVVEICQRLDGIPLAIELAASRMASMTASEVRDRLDDRFRLLVGSRRGLARHHTLRHTVAWSYDLLDDAEKTLLARCSVFAGGFDLESACAVAGSDDPDDYAILDLLDALVRKSLLVADRSSGRTRFSMLETIRQFAEEQLVARDEATEIRDAHARHFAGREADIMALWNSPRQRDAYDWFTAELANLRTAFRWAADHGDLGVAAPIATYGTILGLWVDQYEPIAWAEELIEPARAVDHPWLATLYVMASQCFISGRPEAAVGYSDACQMVISNDDEVPYGFRGLLGSAYQFIGQPERSVDWYRAQLARSRDAHATLTRGALVQTLVIAGCADDAMAATTGLIDAAEATCNPLVLSFALLAYGFAFRDADPDRAREALRRGLVIAQDSGNRDMETHLAACLARHEAEHGDPMATLEYSAVAIGNYHDAGNTVNMRASLAALAARMDRLGRYEPAATIAGFAFDSVIAVWVPEINTAIAHLRDVLGDQTYESLARTGETMTAAAMAAYAYDQIDLARIELNTVLE